LTIKCYCSSGLPIGLTGLTGLFSTTLNWLKLPKGGYMNTNNESLERQIVELVKQYDFALVPEVERIIKKRKEELSRRIHGSPAYEVALCNLQIPKTSEI